MRSAGKLGVPWPFFIRFNLLLREPEVKRKFGILLLVLNISIKSFIFNMLILYMIDLLKIEPLMRLSSRLNLPKNGLGVPAILPGRR